MTERRLSRDEFQRLFLALYPALVRDMDRDAVHTVYVMVMDSGAYKGLERAKKRVKAWLMVQIRIEQARHYRTEKMQFGKRRINQGD